jgi:hypothetical protein
MIRVKASQPRKSVTLWPQLGGETTDSIRDMWWKWGDMYYNWRGWGELQAMEKM